jgi:Protein of unknown function (DUF3800)
MLEAYFDESGTHAGSRTLSVGAFVADQDKWIAFSRQWKATLAEAGIECFHARSRSSVSLRAALVDAVRALDGLAVVASVDPAVFKAAAGEHLKSEFGSAYANCAFWCAYKITNWTLEHGLGSVVCVFEGGQPGIDKTMAVFRKMKMVSNRDPRMMIAGIMEATKAEFRGLQVADFIAHSRSTGSKRWLDAIKGAASEAYDEVITAEILAEVSIDVRNELARQKALRRKIARGPR